MLDIDTSNYPDGCRVLGCQSLSHSLIAGMLTPLGLKPWLTWWGNTRLCTELPSPPANFCWTWPRAARNSTLELSLNLWTIPRARINHNNCIQDLFSTKNPTGNSDERKTAKDDPPLQKSKYFKREVPSFGDILQCKMWHFLIPKMQRKEPLLYYRLFLSTERG